MTDTDDVFEITEFEDEQGFDHRLKLSYYDRTGAKDQITVREYEGDDFTSYNFNVDDLNGRECYYAPSGGNPKPSINAIRVLNENGWEVTNFTIAELRDDHREESHKTLADILRVHETLDYGLYQGKLSSTNVEASAEEAIDTDSEIVQRLTLEAGARTTLLRWIVEAEDRTGKPFGELIEDEEALAIFEGEMSFIDERHAVVLMELFGEIMGEISPPDWNTDIDGLDHRPNLQAAIDRGFNRGQQKNDD